MRCSAAFSLAAAALLAACGGDREAEQAPADPPPAESAAAAPAAPDTGLSVVVRKSGDAGYALHGTAPVPVLQVSVEDGHNVLFGPAEVQVVGGRFRMDFGIDATEMPTVFAYFTTPEGERQWVVPVPRSQAYVTWSSGGQADSVAAEHTAH